MRVRLVALALLALPATAMGADDPKNYCENPESAKEWRELAKKHPKDDAIQRLHALRLGLCELIERGTMTVERGTVIFERQRQQVIRERKQKERQGMGLHQL